MAAAPGAARRRWGSAQISSRPARHKHAASATDTSAHTLLFTLEQITVDGGSGPCRCNRLAWSALLLLLCHISCVLTLQTEGNN